MRNYATQMDAAKRGIVTPEIETVARKENRPVEFIMERVAKGTIAIPANINHKSLSAEAVGDGTHVKINVNLGISGDCKDYEMELRKVRMAIDMGAESIMDLSNYGKTNTFRKQLIDMSPAMIGTVPMYDAIGYLEKDLLEITAQDFLRVVEAHAQEGVDFMTIHAGINRRAVEAFMREGRKMNIVSRGGSLLFAWMQMTGNENPFFEYYDDVLDILRRYDVTISLGDALRPGCIDDASDAGQISELIELGNLAKRAWDKDVQVMIEGPGHMAMNEIAANMQMEMIFSNMMQAAAIYEYSDGNIEVVRVNDAYFDLFGYHDTDRVHKEIEGSIDHVDRERFMDTFAQVVENQSTAECEVKRFLESGREIWIKLRLKYINRVGERHIIFGCIDDITVQREMDNELAKYRLALMEEEVNEKTMLVVDDMEINRASLESIFETDYRILQAGDGEEALHILEEQNYKVDMILLDLMMPGMNGQTFMQERKNDPRILNIPVVIITADDTTEQQVLTMELGASDYIVKPFIPEIVTRRVQNVWDSTRRKKEVLQEHQK